MAGTIVVTSSEVGLGAIEYSIAWTSDAAGAVSGIDVPVMAGTLMRAATVPAAAGDAPTDNYDVVVTDAYGVDLLAAAGANRSATVSQGLSPGVAMVRGNIQPTISNAGNAKKGTLSLVVRPWW